MRTETDLNFTTDSDIPIAISAKDVDLTFQTPDGTKSVLKHLNLSLAKGSWTALIGKNGCGKSTLGRILAGLYHVSRGHITFPAKSSTHGLYVQMVFQNPDAQIIGQTVYEDIAFGLENLGIPQQEMPQKAEAALHSVGLKIPLDTPVQNLSGGQKQLLCIADCLAVNAEVLIFDECSSMLDEQARQWVYQTVRALHQAGKTIIWITQHLEELKDAEQVIALTDGHISFQGTPQQFFYGETTHSLPSQTPCQKHGFTPPYMVQVALELRQKGHHIDPLPLSIKDWQSSRQWIHSI